MALVNNHPDYNFIFIHVPKCGGTTLRRLLPPYKDHEGVGWPYVANEFEVLGKHADAVDVRDYYRSEGKGELWDNIFKFAFVRNPFDWMVSFYFWLREVAKHPKASEPFNLFVPWYLDNLFEKDLKYGTNKFQTQSAMVMDDRDNILVDFLGRMESFEVDATIVLRRVLPYVPPPLGRLNKSLERAFGYRQYYNDELRCLVTKAFDRDLRNFNYSF